jgi:hypothetical protein
MPEYYVAAFAAGGDPLIGGGTPIRDWICESASLREAVESLAATFPDAKEAGELRCTDPGRPCPHTGREETTARFNDARREWRVVRSP